MSHKKSIISVSLLDQQKSESETIVLTFGLIE